MRAGGISKFYLAFSLAVAAVVVLSASPPLHANVLGSDLQSFNPTSDGLDFVTVHSGRTLGSGVLNVGAFVDYAKNTLPDALMSQTANSAKFKAGDQMTSSDFHLALGLLNDWEAGFNISTLVSGSTDSDRLGSYFSKRGMTDARFDTKYRFYSTRNVSLALALTANFPQIANDPFLGDRTSPMYEAELALSSVSGQWVWGANGGYRMRSPGDTLGANSPYEPVDDQYLASVGLGYHFAGTDWSMVGEVYGAVPAKGSLNYSVSQLTTVEPLVGVKYWASEDLVFHAGATAGIQHGISAPDYRVYAGFNWTPFQLWGRGESTPKPAPPREPEPQVLSSTDSDLSVFDKMPTKRVEKFVVGEIHFDTGSDRVPESFLPFLRKFADYLKKGAPLRRLTISGHTDSRGTVVYNQNLSLRRAQSVKRVLTDSHGIPADQIETVGFGSKNPIDTNETDAGRARNRRVEFEIEREDAKP